MAILAIGDVWLNEEQLLQQFVYGIPTKEGGMHLHLSNTQSVYLQPEKAKAFRQWLSDNSLLKVIKEGKS